ncbi:MAG: SGNH/GDSL hydrolase family protein [Chloroflexota bacterium]
MHLRYVALGDSYTIGTAVARAERFPDQLVARLGPGPQPLRLVANLGVNGATSDDLIGDQLPASRRLDPAFATLLIGVNDVVQGVSMDRYEANLTTILDDLTARVGAERIVTLTVPDYTVTPAGAEYGDPAARSAGIRECNRVMGRLAEARGIACVDVHDISLDAVADRTLVADDGLHPSGDQYARWVERLVPVVARLLDLRT